MNEEVRDDATQLTDGVRTEGYFWTQKSTVGWSGGAPTFITIDLGQGHPIGGASFRTAAGVSGVRAGLSGGRVRHPWRPSERGGLTCLESPCQRDLAT